MVTRQEIFRRTLSDLISVLIEALR